MLKIIAFIFLISPALAFGASKHRAPLIINPDCGQILSIGQNRQLARWLKDVSEVALNNLHDRREDYSPLIFLVAQLQALLKDLISADRAIGEARYDLRRHPQVIPNDIYMQRAFLYHVTGRAHPYLMQMWLTALYKKHHLPYKFPDLILAYGEFQTASRLTPTPKGIEFLFDWNATSSQILFDKWFALALSESKQIR